MTINRVPGGYRGYVTGGGHLNHCPGGGGVRRHNRHLSRGGVEQHGRLSRGVGQNRSSSRGHLQVCPWGVEV